MAQALRKALENVDGRDLSSWFGLLDSKYLTVQALKSEHVTVAKLQEWGIEEGPSIAIHSHFHAKGKRSREEHADSGREETHGAELSYSSTTSKRLTTRDLYDEILAVDLTEDIIEIPDGLRRKLKLAPKLLKREVYDQVDRVADDVAAGRGEKAVNDLHVCGSSKIGKTCYLALRLIKRVQETKNESNHGTVLSVHEDPNCLFLSRECCHEAPYNTFAGLLENTNYEYLVDSHCPASCDAPTILSSTPEKVLGKDWGKNANGVYLPDLSWDEICRIRDLNFKSVSDHELWQKFEKFGGCAKWIFNMSEAAADFEVNEHISKLTLDHIKNPGLAGPSRIASDNLLGYEVDAELRLLSRRFRSKTINERSIKKLKHTSKVQLKEFVYAADRDPLVSGVRGDLFQVEVRDLIEHGGTVTVKTVETQGIEVEELDARQVFRIKALHSIQEAEARGTAAWEPISQGHESIDILLEPNITAQVTVSPAHSPLSLQKVKNNLQALQGFQSHKDAQVWMIVPLNLIHSYETLPLKQAEWPSHILGKKTVLKIVGIDVDAIYSRALDAQ